MSFSCGRVVQFFIVAPLHRKRSEGADDEERTTIRSPRERSELGQTPTTTLQPQCQPQAGAGVPQTKPITENDHPKRNQKPLVVLVGRSRCSLLVLVLVSGLGLGLGLQFAFASGVDGQGRAPPMGRPATWRRSRMRGRPPRPRPAAGGGKSLRRCRRRGAGAPPAWRRWS